MGCELSRQLKSPARACGRSIAGASPLEGRQYACCWLGVSFNVSTIGGVWLRQPATCEPHVRSASDSPWQRLPTPPPFLLLFMHQLDHAVFFVIAVKGMSHL